MMNGADVVKAGDCCEKWIAKDPGKSLGYCSYCQHFSGLQYIEAFNRLDMRYDEWVDYNWICTVSQFEQSWNEPSQDN